MAIKKVKKRKAIKKIKKRRKFKPRTAKTVGTSMAEKEFKKFLESIGFEVNEQFQILYKFYDFIVKDTKILIEFNGDFWHCNPTVYPDGPINKMQRDAIKNDKYKRGLAETRGYTLISVWEKDFNENAPKVKKMLLEELSEYKKNNP